MFIKLFQNYTQLNLLKLNENQVCLAFKTLIWFTLYQTYSKTTHRYKLKTTNFVLRAAICPHSPIL